MPAPPLEPVEPTDPQVWTTPPDSDVCTAFPSKKVAEYQTYPSQAECEDWVKIRRCRPYSHCSDGCNNIGCDRTGMRMTTTLVECGLFVVESVEFVSKTLRASKTPDWAALSQVSQRLLKLPTRQLVINASALPDEVGRSEAAQKQLAKRRGEWVRQQLVAQGMDPQRIRVSILEPAQMGVNDYRIGRAWFTFDPPRLEPEEYDSTYPDYENLCWVKQARSKPAPVP